MVGKVCTQWYYIMWGGYVNVNTNTSSNVDLYKLNVKVEAANKMVQTNKIQKQHKNENK